MKNFLSVIFEFIAHRVPEFKGKIRLLSIYGRVAGKLYVRSWYGMYLVLNFRDFTNRAAVLGWYGTSVSDEVAKLEKGDVFLDIGANAGLFSILAAKEVGSEGLVICLEPQIQMLSQLIDNCIANNISNIMVLGIGVSSTTAMAKFSEFNPFHTGIAKSDSDGGRRVGMVNISEDFTAIEKFIGRRSLTIKIDTEGAELEVIKTIDKILAHVGVRSVIIEIDNDNLRKFGATGSDVYSYMRKAGFTSTVSKEASDQHYDEIFVKQSL